MLKSIRFYTIFICFFYFIFGMQSRILGQQRQAFFKFPVIEDGVYKITAEQAQSLGFSNLDAVGIYGFPGMLPQNLAPIDLNLRQIPSKKIGDELFFYLTGPHQVSFKEEHFNLITHHYSDTLYYVIGHSEKKMKFLTPK